MIRAILAYFALAASLLTPALAQDEGVNGHGFQMVAQDGDPRDLLMTQRFRVLLAGKGFMSSTTLVIQ